MTPPIAEEFDPENLAALPPPFFMRKITRRKSWPDDVANTCETPIAELADEVFGAVNGKFSVFRVQTWQDLMRIAVGINSMRKSLKEDLFLVCIRPEELEAAGLTLERTRGHTACLHANSVHFDIRYNARAVLTLVAIMKESSRERRKIQRAKMARAAEHARTIGCHATDTDLSHCECEAA